MINNIINLVSIEPPEIYIEDDKPTFLWKMYLWKIHNTLRKKIDKNNKRS